MREHPRTGLVAPLLENADGEPQPSGYKRFPSLLTLSVDMSVPISYALSYVPDLHPHVLPPKALAAGGRVAHVTGAAMVIRREAYRDAGPLDESFFMYLEETEWQRRLARRGWMIEIEPAARVCHLIRGGGEAALTPPLQGVKSAMRYLRLQGVPAVLARSALGLTFLSSWLTLRLIACLPSKRSRAAASARAYRRLLRGLR
jgi:GT2 family glycosyltransferase